MNPIEANMNMYSTGHIGYGLPPLSGTTTTTGETTAFLPMYSSVMTDSIPHPLPPHNNKTTTTTTPIKSESGLTTYNLPPPPVAVSRKRQRESAAVNNLLHHHQQHQNMNSNSCNPFSFLGHDFSFQVQQQQFDVDQLILQHMEKVKMEMEEKRTMQARRIIGAIEEGVVKRLKFKEDEIVKIGKLNWALEERVKSLCVENQIWRDLAQTNEAAANALRTNLEQVLAAQVKDDGNDGAAEMDDAQSSCGSSTSGGNDNCGWRTLANAAQDKETTTARRGGACRRCRSQESCVLLLPCRHLCLCSACGSAAHSCPICKATKNGSLHVNLS